MHLYTLKIEIDNEFNGSNNRTSRRGRNFRSFVPWIESKLDRLAEKMLQGMESAQPLLNRHYLSQRKLPTIRTIRLIKDFLTLIILAAYRRDYMLYENQRCCEGLRPLRFQRCIDKNTTRIRQTEASISNQIMRSMFANNEKQSKLEVSSSCDV